jgi:hypothetical protein
LGNLGLKLGQLLLVAAVGVVPTRFVQPDISRRILVDFFVWTTLKKCANFWLKFGVKKLK